MADELDLYLKEGHIVWIDDPLMKYYRIVRREPFDYETGQEDTAIFTAIASGAESGYKNIETLDPDDNPQHLFQVLWGVPHNGNIKYYVKIPSGVNRFGVDEDKEIGFINADKSPFHEPDPLFQFYLISGWYPSINCVNNSAVTIMPKIHFKGMKYDITEIKDAGTIAAIEAGKIPHRRIIFGGVKITA